MGGAYSTIEINQQEEDFLDTLDVDFSNKDISNLLASLRSVYYSQEAMETHLRRLRMYCGQHFIYDKADSNLWRLIQASRRPT